LGASFAVRNDLGIAEEMEFHLQMQIADNLHAGMSPAEARRLALIKSGGLASAREAYRDRLTFPLVEMLARDIRYALRTLRKTPVFTLTVVITLAVAIAANTALFSLLDGVLIRPLPYAEPDRLVVLGSDDARSQGVLVSYADYEKWRQAAAFADVATCTRDSPVTLPGSDAPERVDAAQATPNLFAVLGVAPMLGRGFTVEEAEHDAPVAVISFALWLRWFAASPDALGRTLTMDGRSIRVIGVMPRSFQFPTALIQLWRPIPRRARMASARPFGLFVGRLRANASVPQAQSEIAAPGAYLVPMQQQIAGRGVRVALWSLFGAVSMVLLIACANVSNLLLARGMARQHELATRAALGASQRRLLGQLMVENALLCGFAGASGIPLAFLALRAVVVFAPAGTPRLDAVGLDARVLGFTVIVSCLCILLVGLLPAVEITRSNLQQALKGGRSKAHALIVGELALAMLLLCGAGLMLRSLSFVRHVPLGFDPRDTLVARVALPNDWEPARRARFYDEALHRIQGIPGVTGAGAISNFSLAFSRSTRIEIEGAGECAVPVMQDSASAGLFPALRVPLRSHAPLATRSVAIINQTLSRKCWPDQDAVGKRFRIAGEWVTVVGIAPDMRRNGMENDGAAQVFLPLDQWPTAQADLVIKATTPDSLAPRIRRELASLDARIPVFRISTLDERLAAEQVPRRFETGLLTVFAGVALFLAAIGIYGVMHYSVARRTPEIGIRMAAGAHPANVLSMVLRQGCRLAAFGIACGVIGSLLLNRLFSSLPLFGVTAQDPATFAVAVALIAMIIVLACWIPARKAASVDPQAALRHE
jgi:putative ABC transport system permease protein